MTNNNFFEILKNQVAYMSMTISPWHVVDIYISGGTFTIDAEDDGIQGTTIVQIDGGTFGLSAGEAIEGTYVQINGGTIGIEASDDGINASNKSTAVSTLLEINGGELTINMAQGDTDALDSNGDLIINGGTVDITAQFAFDFERSAELNGGTVTVNGEQVTSITNSMMGGGMMGGRGGMGGGFPGGTDGEQPEMPEGGFDGQTDGTRPERPEGGFGGMGGPGRRG